MESKWTFEEFQALLDPKGPYFDVLIDEAKIATECELTKRPMYLNGFTVEELYDKYCDEFMDQVQKLFEFTSDQMDDIYTNSVYLDEIYKQARQGMYAMVCRVMNAPLCGDRTFKTFAIKWAVLDTLKAN